MTVVFETTAGWPPRRVCLGSCAAAGRIRRDARLQQTPRAPQVDDCCYEGRIALGSGLVVLSPPLCYAIGHCIHTLV